MQVFGKSDKIAKTKNNLKYNLFEQNTEVAFGVLNQQRFYGAFIVDSTEIPQNPWSSGKLKISRLLSKTSSAIYHL